MSAAVNAFRKHATQWVMQRAVALSTPPPSPRAAAMPTSSDEGEATDDDVDIN